MVVCGLEGQGLAFIATINLHAVRAVDEAWFCLAWSGHWWFCNSVTHHNPVIALTNRQRDTRRMSVGGDQDNCVLNE